MAYTKSLVNDKVQSTDNKKFPKKFKIMKEKGKEEDIDIDIAADGEYLVEKLSIDNLPTTIDDGTSITWINNFRIQHKVKKNVNGSEVEEWEPINQSYTVKIQGVSNWKNQDPKKRLVVYDGNAQKENRKPDVYSDSSISSDDTFELTDGDPAVGSAP